MFSNNALSTQHVQYMLLFLVLVVKLNSNQFQILQSYTLLLQLPVLMHSLNSPDKCNVAESMFPT